MSLSWGTPPGEKEKVVFFKPKWSSSSKQTHSSLEGLALLGGAAGLWQGNRAKEPGARFDVRIWAWFFEGTCSKWKPLVFGVSSG